LLENKAPARKKGTGPFFDGIIVVKGIVCQS